MPSTSHMCLNLVTKPVPDQIGSRKMRCLAISCRTPEFNQVSNTTRYSFLPHYR